MNASAATVQVLTASAATVQTLSASAVSVSGAVSAGSLVVAGSANVSGRLTLGGYMVSPYALITVAGSTQGSAASLTARINLIATAVAGGPEGAILPVPVTGQDVYVINAANTAVDIYPATGAAIWGGSTNAAISVTASTIAHFMAVSSIQWYVKRGN